MTNELVAKESGIESIFRFFKESRYYKKGRNFELLRDQVLSQDETKLGDVAKLLFRLLDLYKKIQSDGTALSELLHSDWQRPEIRNQMNITNIRALAQKLRSLSGVTMEAYVHKLFEKYGAGDTLYDECVRHALAKEINSPTELKAYIQEHLFSCGEDSALTEVELEKDRGSIQDFLTSAWTFFIVGMILLLEIMCGLRSCIIRFTAQRGRNLIMYLFL